MHWRLGELDMAHRAGVVPFSMVNPSPSNLNPIPTNSASLNQRPLAAKIIKSSIPLLESSQLSGARVTGITEGLKDAKKDEGRG